jgi:hypothetical protein
MPGKSPEVLSDRNSLQDFELARAAFITRGAGISIIDAAFANPAVCKIFVQPSSGEAGEQ